jgi:hypothetical protein
MVNQFFDSAILTITPLSILFSRRLIRFDSFDSNQSVGPVLAQDARIRPVLLTSDARWTCLSDARTIRD